MMPTFNVHENSILYWAALKVYLSCILGKIKHKRWKRKPPGLDNPLPLKAAINLQYVIYFILLASGITSSMAYVHHRPNYTPTFKHIYTTYIYILTPTPTYSSLHLQSLYIYTMMLFHFCCFLCCFLWSTKTKWLFEQLKLKLEQ